MNRRQLMQWGLGLLGMTALQAVAGEKRAARPAAGAPAAGAEPFVDPATDPMAKAINYVAKKSDLTKAELKTEKQGVKFDDQNCAGCMLYVSVGKKAGAEAGKCTLFAGKLVPGEAWCTSWAKKV